MIKEIHIFDFDGTLVDSTHRYKTLIDKDGNEKIDLQYWLDNEHKAGEDKPIPSNVRMFKSVAEQPETYTVIATARIWCDKADQVCQENGIEPNAIVDRKHRENRIGGAELKINFVKKLLNLKQFAGVNVIHIYEDNLTYLKKIQKAFNAVSHFYPSEQGH